MSAEILTVTDENFNAAILGAKEPALLLFGARWCPHCTRLGPAIETLAEDFSDGRFIIARVDIDKSPMTRKRFDVQGIPRMFITRNGEEVEDVSLARTAEGLRLALEGHLNGNSFEEVVKTNLDHLPFRFNYLLEKASLSDVREILEKNPDYASEHDELGRTPTGYAAREGKDELFDLLVEFGGKVHATSLAALGRLEALRAHLKQHPEQLNEGYPRREDISEKWAGIVTPRPALLFALSRQEREIVDMLLELGVSPNCTIEHSEGGSTENVTMVTLMVIPEYELDTVKHLVANGLDLLSKGFNGKSALHFAAQGRNDVPLAEYLVSLGVDPLGKDDNGKTPLDYALEAEEKQKQDRTSLIKYLKGLQAA